MYISLFNIRLPIIRAHKKSTGKDDKLWTNGMLIPKLQNL